MDPLTMVVLVLFGLMIIAWVAVPTTTESHADAVVEPKGATSPASSAQ